MTIGIGLSALAKECSTYQLPPGEVFEKTDEAQSAASQFLVEIVDGQAHALASQLRVDPACERLFANFFVALYSRRQIRGYCLTC